MPPTPKLPANYVGCQVEGTASEPYFPVRMGHLFAGDGTTWLAVLPVMGPPRRGFGASGCSAAVLAE